MFKRFFSEGVQIVHKAVRLRILPTCTDRLNCLTETGFLLATFFAQSDFFSSSASIEHADVTGNADKEKKSTAENQLERSSAY